jgi:hypothetical protein
MSKGWAVIVALGVGLDLGLGLGFAVAKDYEVVSKTEFVVGAGECGLNFTITYHNEAIKGSIAYTENGFALRMPIETFFVIDGKLSEDAGAVFGAIILGEKVGVGLLSDGAIFPIDALGLDRRAIADCVWERWQRLRPAREAR